MATAIAPGSSATGTAPAARPVPEPPAAPDPGVGRVRRLRAAVATTPGRLRLASAVLAVLMVTFAAVAALQAFDRASAADRLASDTGPLSRRATEIYRSLADADTTAAGGFLLGDKEPPALRQRYQDDLATAARLLTESATSSGGSAEAQRLIASLNTQLPQYAGQVETARALSRQRLPLGGAYLRYASAQMQDTMLADAQRLVDTQQRRLDDDFAAAEAFPTTAVLLAAVTLLALGYCQLALFRRTSRVFNIGLLAASAAVLVGMLWLAVGAVSAGDALAKGRDDGAHPLRLLGQARIDALQAHAAENLDLVARGGSEKYTVRWNEEQNTLAPADPAKGTLRDAVRAAPDAARTQMASGVAQFEQWKARHGAAAAKGTDYDAQLALTISATAADTSDAAFTAMDGSLAQAAAAEDKAFADAVHGVDGDLRILGIGVAVLAVLGAASAVRGIDRRLAEYR
ncbi:hypothetical protein [Yinghuangia seranimata]|uniref:hypothetical protein n=1 Tax=Yinghuangia seranimata TaxID=408067 RepID=UPI00248D0100|nr:hypothetical protein [Yinghuangia seranimata]MDI2131045.1 hypothetical protein [Yinghuangia seranimata]